MKTPPHSEEAEQAVLGSMMLSPDALAQVTEMGLKTDDFYRIGHRLLFDTMMGLYGQGKPVDVITAIDELKSRGNIDGAGGALYLQSLIESVGATSSAGYYAKIVMDQAILRKVITFSGEALQAAYEVPGDVNEFVDTIEGKLYHLSHGRRGDDVIPLRRVVDESINSLEQAEDGVSGVPTGFRSLDSLLQGFHPANLIVIAARPGIGKSALVTNIARNIAVKNDKPVLFFSLEMSSLEIGMRLLSSEARVASQKIRAKTLSPDDWSRIVDAAEILHKAPLWVIDSSALNVANIRARARTMSSTQGLSLVVVDYLQLMSSHIRTENRQQEIALISRSLKLLSKELGVPIVAVSQLNRDPEKRTDRRPQLSDLRESGAIEADADIVLLIHRQDQGMDTSKAEVIIAKHRNGPQGVVSLVYRAPFTQFVDQAVGYEPT